MTEKKSSQVHNESPATTPVDPFAAWKSIARENMERVEAMFAETDRMEAESLERTKQALDESSRLALETMVWATRMGAEWRKLMLGGIRRSTTAG